ncbi:MAG: hypothetical protein ACKOCK_10640, partial [Chloroflexota bacterium]
MRRAYRHSESAGRSGPRGRERVEVDLAPDVLLLAGDTLLVVELRSSTADVYPADLSLDNQQR